MKTAIRLLVILGIFAAPAWAVPVELKFTNADVNLGDGSVIVLAGNEYSAFGITITDAYRYIDGRDPFSDAPDDFPAPCANENTQGRCQFGLSNNTDENPGVIDFLTPASSVSFDWWVLAGRSIESQFQVFDENNMLVLDFIPDVAGGELSGTINVPGLVSSITFLNFLSGGIQVSNLRYDTEIRVAEPGTILLLSLGLLAIRFRNRTHR